MMTTQDVCRVAGCSYRQLDYWIRLGVISPSKAQAHGPGSRRLFHRHQARVVGMLTDLAALGAGTDVLRGAATAELPAGGLAFVDEAGRVTPEPPGGSCWLVDLDTIGTAPPPRALVVA